MAFDKGLHLQRNIDAIRTLFRIEKEGRMATAGEKAVLRQFSGFGGLKFSGSQSVKISLFSYQMCKVRIILNSVHFRGNDGGNI
jgi:hypothetical protein